MPSAVRRTKGQPKETALEFFSARLAAMGATQSTPPGLYLVATPIGNLEDITFRAVRVLKEVDLIACEDTRQTQKLLNHYSIPTRTTSYHEHNELTKSPELLKQLLAGSAIALVTDAGMPGISDPGYRLITLAIENHVPVTPIPGASAFLSALVASGLPTDSFRFAGFLPVKRGERRTALADIKDASQPQIFYEAPHRLLETLTDITEVLGPSRPIVVARELTKVHEEFLRGPVIQLLEALKQRDMIKGEITLLIGKPDRNETGVATDAVVRLNVSDRVQQIMSEEKIDEKAALKKVAKERGISKSEAYRELQRTK